MTDCKRLLPLKASVVLITAVPSTTISHLPIKYSKPINISTTAKPIGLEKSNPIKGMIRQATINIITPNTINGILPPIKYYYLLKSLEYNMLNHDKKNP